jgi:hypothetical protein
MSTEHIDLLFELAPHTALFRLAFERIEDARFALRAVLPAPLSRLVDWPLLAPAHSRFESAAPSTGRDLLFVAPFGSVEIFLRVLLEGDTPSPTDLLLRALNGQIAVWDVAERDALPLRPVIPVAVHHGSGHWPASPLRERGLEPTDPVRGQFAEFAPQLDCIVEDLARFDPASLAQRADLADAPRVRCAYFLLQRARESAAFEEEIPLLREDLVALARDPHERAFLAALIRYVLYVANGDEHAIIGELRDAIGSNLVEGIVGKIAERWIEKGKAVGEAYGKVTGEAQGRSTLILRQLELRFGPLPIHARHAINHASLVGLEAMAERILTAQSLDEVLAVR